MFVYLQNEQLIDDNNDNKNKLKNRVEVGADELQDQTNVQ
jgi:hypothetical protein